MPNNVITQTTIAGVKKNIQVFSKVKSALSEGENVKDSFIEVSGGTKWAQLS